MKVNISDGSVEDFITKVYLYLERRFDVLIIENDVKEFFIKTVAASSGVCIALFAFLIGLSLFLLKDVWFLVIGSLVCCKSLSFLLCRAKWLCGTKSFVTGEITNIECSNPTGCPNHDKIVLRISYQNDLSADSRSFEYSFGCPHWGDFIGEVTLEKNDMIKGERKSWVLPIPVVVVYLRNDPDSVQLLGLKKQLI
jgi:hypothetical protein